MLAHCLGLAGELFNCIGAFILALDIFLRKKGEEELKGFEEMSAHARTFDSPATYRGFVVASPSFAKDLTNWNAMKLASIGTALLVVGFALLVGYHLLEMNEIRHVSTTSSEFRNLSFRTEKK